MSHTIKGANMSNATAQRVYDERCWTEGGTADCRVHPKEGVDVTEALAKGAKITIHSTGGGGGSGREGGPTEHVGEIPSAKIAPTPPLVTELPSANEALAMEHREQVRLITERDDAMQLLRRIRPNLNRWAARYAKALHAQKSVRETRLLMNDIDALWQKYPHCVKD